MSIHCPECGCTFSAVKDSRPTDTRAHGLGTIRRRRVCEGCDHRFTTYEVTAATIDALLEPQDVVGFLRDLRERTDKMLFALGGESKPF